jgi:RNA polymerase sigma-70 factor (ECF subfamily)
MPPPLSLTDLEPLHRLADEQARRLCRSLRLAAHEQEDIRQDLLADLLARLPDYDAERGELGGFAATCFKHRAARLALWYRRERAGRAVISLDDPLPGGEGLTIGAALAEDAGYGAWLGQPTDRITMVERRLDLERASQALTADDMPLLAALARGDTRAHARAGLSRTTAFRMVHEMRLRLFAAGVASAA